MQLCVVRLSVRRKPESSASMVCSFLATLVLADRLLLSSISCLCVFWIDEGLGWGTSVRYVGYAGLRMRVV